MSYNKYELSEIFDKIDKLLQRYFDKKMNIILMRKMKKSEEMIYLRKVI